MSQASEWEARRKLNPPPAFSIGEQVVALVTQGGDFYFASPVRQLSQATALALAHWIIDTFGEPTP